MNIRKIVWILPILCGAYMQSAAAIEYNYGRTTMRVTGGATAGVISPDFDDTKFLGDWHADAQFKYNISSNIVAGLVYGLDAQELDEHHWAEDAFFMIQDRNIGRVELGLTESVAGKLGLGLPDVGGLRVNDNPLFYKKIHPHGPVIADTTIDSGHTAMRINMVSVQMGGVQYGVSASGLTGDYKYALDAGIKLRNSAGKFKTALSIGASFIDDPDGYHPDPYAPHLTADWRAQMGAGFNLQYNSWILATTVRAIYDRDARGVPSDGIAAGIGASYDFLAYSASLSYIFSDTGLWHSGADEYTDNTVVASVRYKYNKYLDAWTSGGVSRHAPFIAAGLRITF